MSQIDTSSLAIDHQKTAASQAAFQTLSNHVRQVLNTDIDYILAHANLPQPLYDACHYTMTGDGKRVRPLLVASSYLTISNINSDIAKGSTADKSDSAIDCISVDNNVVNDKTVDDIVAEKTAVDDMPYQLSDACRRAMLAVELLHTYSLIHDDLPALDDDDLRRGRPTCHIQFGEATAILAGDVLQTLAFEVLSADIRGFTPLSITQIASLNTVFAPRSRRMVAGQMQDINAENKTITQTALESIHRDKTGALIEASVLMGAACAHADPKQMASLQQFAQNIGLAFQVQDDILDVTANTAALGKPAGSDEKLSKSTYVKLMGVTEATEYAQALFAKSMAALPPLSTNNIATDTPLLALAQWLWQRKK